MTPGLNTLKGHCSNGQGGRRADVRSQYSEVGRQKPKIRGQRTYVRDQRTVVRGQRVVKCK